MTEKYYLLWDELFDICHRVEKHIKSEIDKKNGKEKFEYKLYSNTKNGLMICLMFSKIQHSYYHWEIELVPRNADVIINDFGINTNDDKLKFSLFSRNFENLIVFPWE
jgi:hypothetical protein